MSECRVLVGDCIDLLPTLPEESVHCVVTSPPFWGLRDYGTGEWEGGEPECDHEPARRSIGNSPSVKSTLTTNGGRGPKAGDKYSAGSQGGYARECSCGARRIDRQIGLEATPEEYVEKLVGVMREVRRVIRSDATVWINLGDSYAANRSYQVTDQKWRDVGNTKGSEVPTGLKPKDLVGIPWRVAFALQADGWWLRSAIVWAKSNPMPESVTDRPTSSYEHVFLLARSEKYYYDADAIREPGGVNGGGFSRNYAEAQPGHGAMKLERGDYSAGRNKRNVWTIATKPFPQAHFATFPEDLVTPCVLAGSPLGGTVLDPFAGAGTVGVVCSKLGRDFIGIELNAEYAAMARTRIAGAPLSLFAAAAP